MLSHPQVTPIQEIHDPRLDHAGVRLLVKRLDLVHPLISGNKWYKLKYNLTAAREQGYQALLSFGGAWSNHIHALAAAGRIYGFDTIGVIRGEEITPLNPVLRFAAACGMQLHYIDRETYRQKESAEFIDLLHDRFGEFYLIPEGGSNALAVMGCAEIIAEIDQPFDVIACACGTAGTLSGLVAGLQGEHQALGVGVLKGADFLRDNIEALLAASRVENYGNWRIELDYHCGGYAKTTSQLLAFVHDFETQHGIPLEPLYTGKLFYALFDMIAKEEFSRGTTVVALHSGGLQGRMQIT